MAERDDVFRILVVDDHKLFREGLIALLEAAPERAQRRWPRWKRWRPTWC